jgi:two-component system sensor histidine kinase/response regulator
MAETKILVIDDEPGIREGCKRALSPRGMIVEMAENGAEGLKKVATADFDLVLIDIMMPGTNGIDLIEPIHAKDPEIVCIIITGYATVELAIRAIKAGAYDFLTKPFTVDELLHVVNQGLERRRLSLGAKRLQAVEAEAFLLAEEKARLEELDRAKVAFIRLVTHELKAPISAISNYLDLILKGYVPPEQQRDILIRAQDRAAEQIALISDLLEFGQLKDTQSPLRSEPIRLDGILRSVVSQVESQTESKNIRLLVDIAEDCPPVCLSVDQARSIWTNLISNAIKFTANGGYIEIKLWREENCLQGQVKDSGIGIPEEAKPNLFSEFYRAQNAKALSIPGTGLGLAIVRQIIEKAGGKIWFESEVGKGSSFHFSLPLAEM